jgi:hypothetical protein
MFTSQYSSVIRAHWEGQQIVGLTQEYSRHELPMTRFDVILTQLGLPANPTHL